MLAVLLLFNLTALTGQAFHYHYQYPETWEEERTEVVTSTDGKFMFFHNTQTNEASFIESYEKDITVLEIPDEIDGIKVTGTSICISDSSSLVKIKFGKNIKKIYKEGLSVYSNNQKSVFCCGIELNEGLEEICRDAENTQSVSNKRIISPSIKTMILPKSLKKIGENGLNTGRIYNLIVQSNIEADKHSVSKNAYKENRLFAGFDYSDRTSCNIYLTSDITNFDDLALNQEPWNDPDYALNDHIDTEFNPDTTIYKTPDTKGVEKFEKMGYPVKEYTEEWWHDLAEIEEVTMTAEGMSEKTEQVGNGLSDSARKYLSHEYEKSVKSGEKFTVSSAFAPSDAYDDRTFFVSMDETVATVDTETGEVTALKKGTARIRCVAASGVFSDCILKVDGGDNTNGVQHYTEYDYGETTLPKETTTDPDLSANQTKTTDWKEFFFANKLYIIIPVAAAAILTAAVVVIKKKKR